MKPILSSQDRNRLQERIADAEKRTGAQIVLAVVRRSDVYAELPWIAFALGASLAGLAVVLADAFSSAWPSRSALLIQVAAILGAGALPALLTVLFPGFAKLFLAGHREETEVQQYAESLFLRKELSATAGRTGLLILVSLFERRVIVLPDKGLDSRLGGGETRAAIAAMKPFLADGKWTRALETGLDRLIEALEPSAKGGPSRTGRNELPDQIIEEKGV